MLQELLDLKNVLRLRTLNMQISEKNVNLYAWCQLYYQVVPTVDEIDTFLCTNSLRMVISAKGPVVENSLHCSREGYLKQLFH